MLRSLRARVLVATIGVACAAVAATAWLTYWGTTNRLRAGARREAQTDAYVYDTLRSYARTHPTWQAVDDRLDDLAETAQRRIVIATLDGHVVADSAGNDAPGAGPGTGPPLPARPATVIDALDSAAGLPTEDRTGTARSEATADAERRPPYPLTHAELAEREGIADIVSDCLTAAGIGHVPIRGDDEAPQMFVDDADEGSPAYRRCVDTSGLDAPSAAEIDVRNDESRLIGQCLAREGVEFTSRTLDGVVALELDLRDGTTSDVYQRCADGAFRTANDPYVADPVRLYLGDRDEPVLALHNAGTRRTVAAAGLVAVLAIGLSVLASRRVLRPVAALTAAAQRMERGDLTRRVDLDDRGRDEIAGLAHAFNAMADALGEQEELRRRLINDVAHELRTPLANIRGYLEVALDEITPIDHDLLGSLHEEAILLQQLIDDLQTLSLLEAGRLTLRPETVDLAELADQVITARLARAATEGVTLDLAVEPAGEAVPVHADPVRVRQALGNLVDNALRHTPRDGRVAVAVQPQAGHAVVDVADTGEGIAPEHLPHLFDRFWRADTARTRATGGSGLGLPIFRELIEQQHGSIAVASKPSIGSTFSFRLPLASQAPDDEPPNATR